MKNAILVGVFSMSAFLTDRVHASDAHTVLGAVVGAAVGSAIGNHTNGRDGAIIGGAIGGAVGASVGSDIDRDDHVGKRPRYERGEHHEHDVYIAPPEHHHHHYYSYNDHPSDRRYKNWRKYKKRRDHYFYHYDRG